MTDRPASREHGFALGLLAGSLAGLVGLAFLPGASIVALVAIVVGGLARPRPWGLAGTLMGTGASLAAVLWRADQACRPGECVGPDLLPWFSVAGLLVVLGGLLVGSLIVRGRRTDD